MVKASIPTAHNAPKVRRAVRRRVFLELKRALMRLALEEVGGIEGLGGGGSKSGAPEPALDAGCFEGCSW